MNLKSNQLSLYEKFITKILSLFNKIVKLKICLKESFGIFIHMTINYCNSSYKIKRIRITYVLLLPENTMYCLSRI